MIVRREDRDGLITVLRLEGKLNMVSATYLRDSVDAAIVEGRVRIAVDLSGVDFIDSSGLGALIHALKSARNAGGDVRIASPNEQVQLVLQLTNMHRILGAYADADTAFAGTAFADDTETALTGG